MLQNYISQVSNIIDNSSFENFLKKIDYNSLTINDLDKLFEKIDENNKLIYLENIDLPIMIDFLENIDKKIIGNNDITFYEYLNNIVFLSNNKYKKSLVKYFFENNIYNDLILSIYLYNIDVFNNISLPDIYIDNFIEKVKTNDQFNKYINIKIDSYIKYILEKHKIFDNKLLNRIINDNLTHYIKDKYIERDIKYIKLIFELHNEIDKGNIDTLINGNFINKIRNYNENIIEFIIEYIENIFQLPDIKNNLPNNILEFLDRFMNYIEDKVPFKEDIDLLNEISIKITLYLDDLSIDSLLKNYKTFDYYLLSDIYIYIYNQNIDNQLKLDKLSLMTLMMIDYLKKDSIDNIQNFMFNSKYTTSICLALLNSTKFINNIDNINISDQSEYLILKLIKNVDKTLYNENINKAKEELENIKELSSIVDI